MLSRLAVLAFVSFAATFTLAGSRESITLDVQRMDCAACPVTVKAVLKKQAGVDEVKVDLKKGTAEVTFDSAKVSPERLAQVVTEAGFPSAVRK